MLGRNTAIRSLNVRAGRPVAHHGCVSTRDPLVIAAAQPSTVSFDVAANAASTRNAQLCGRALDRRSFPEALAHRRRRARRAVVAPPDDPCLYAHLAAARRPAPSALSADPWPGTRGPPHRRIPAIDARGAAVAYRKMWAGRRGAGPIEPGPAHPPSSRRPAVASDSRRARTPASPDMRNAPLLLESAPTWPGCSRRPTTPR